MRSLSLLAFALAALLASQAHAQPTLAAHAVEAGAVQLDGVLDEAAWGQAGAAGDFVQQRPDAGAAASEPTTAEVLYDGSAIYVGMRMADSQPGQIDARLGRRDAYLETDWASVMIDSYNDDRTAFMFRVNPAGVRVDRLLFDDVDEDQSWDAVWEVATTRDDRGWTAEFRIPLSQLRFSSGAGAQTWGLNFQRIHFRTGETSYWAPVLPSEQGLVSRFGALADLRGLRPPRQLEVVPYLAASVERAPGDAADPFYRATEASPRLGADLKYGLSSDLTLTATVNPDFGQVEADPAQVNLGGFELFFQERRPFFVEGTDVFSMEPRRYFSNGRPDLLYTRRIGRAPQRGSFVPDEAEQAAGDNGTVYTDAPQQSTILGAAKLSGRVGRVSFGVLNAVTGPEYGSFQALDPDERMVLSDRALIEPTTNYAVGRARATFGRTLVGGLATSVVRSTADAAIGDLLPAQATVAGLDVEHPFGDWIVNGQVAGSVVTGSERALERVQRAFPRLYQRPDAGHLTLDTTRTALAGFTGEANLLKTAGEHWLVGVHANATSPGFDSNGLGFQSRADQVGGGTVVIYNQNQPQGAFQRWGANVFGGLAWNFAGDRTNTFVGGNVDGTFRNFWGFGVNGNAGTRTVDDRGTRGGPLMTDPAGGRLNLNAWTDDRKAVSGYAWTGASRDELGGWFHGAELGVEVRPSSSLSIDLSPEVGFSHDVRQYVGAFDAPGLDATFGRRYVFGTIEQTTVSLNARLNWTFTPTLSLQTYLRPFVSRGDYTSFRQLTEPGQLDLPVYGQGAGSIETLTNGDGAVSYRVTGDDGGTAEFDDPSFTVRALQGNAVLRWEYRPGSALFVVWQQQRNGFEPDGALRFGRDVRGIFRDTPTNVFLVKLSYWLGG